MESSSRFQYISLQKPCLARKIFYSELEKIAYAIIMAARKLRHYFEGHRIRVITNQH
jgi:hypothetical protein